MMMLSKSITPLKLTAYKFYTLNLESFSAVRLIFYIDHSLNRHGVILKFNDHSGPYHTMIINTKFYTYINIDN